MVVYDIFNYSLATLAHDLLPTALDAVRRPRSGPYPAAVEEGGRAG